MLTKQDGCALCGCLTLGDLEQMIHTGWAPSYYIGEDEQDGPVCPECMATRLRLADDGELELIEHHESESKVNQ